MIKHGFILAVSIAALSLAYMFVSFAGEWKQDDKGWWYQEDDGCFPKLTDAWIDGDNDGIAESYYFDKDGYLITTPFEEVVNRRMTFVYNMNADGALMIDGVVQSKPVYLDSTIKQYNFVNETIKDIINKDVAYVDSVLGASNRSFHRGGQYVKYYQNKYIVTFVANRCVGINCKGSDMFKLTKEDYTIQDIALELGLGVDEHGRFHLKTTQDVLEWITVDFTEKGIKDSYCSYFLIEGEFYSNVSIIYK